MKDARKLPLYTVQTAGTTYNFVCY